MNSRDRVLTTMNHKEPDVVPSFEAWIEWDILEQMGIDSQYKMREHLQIDCMPVAVNHPDSTNAWRTGVDEWGRIFKDGQYEDGTVKSLDDLSKFTPPLKFAEEWFPRDQIKFARETYGETHAMYYASHDSCLTLAYMSMGLTTFFKSLHRDPELVRAVMDRSTAWTIAMIENALAADPDFILIGDDVAYKTGPMMSPKMFRQFVFPAYRKIVKAAAGVPLYWHSDGDILPLISMIKEAGFKGIHSWEPSASITMKEVKRNYGKDFVLLGNLDCSTVLVQSNRDILYQAIDKLMADASPGGGFIFSSSNSLFPPMIPGVITDAFQYAKLAGKYN